VGGLGWGRGVPVRQELGMYVKKGNTTLVIGVVLVVLVLLIFLRVFGVI
jgi:hypothetical protein